VTLPRTLVGLPVSPGIAIGRPLVVENRPLPVVRVALAAEQVEGEVERLRAAARTAASHMQELSSAAAAAVGHEYASIFDAHKLMLEDPTLLGALEQVIRSECVNAEWALESVTRKLLQQFDQLADVYLRERRIDLLDVAAELQRALQGRMSPSLHLRPGNGERVLTADDIPPSQAIQLANGAIAGFASEAGGATSHTTIIAKSLGIPAVVGVSGLVAAAARSARIIVDGFEGHVIVDPDEALVRVYTLRAEEHRRRHAELLHQAGLPPVTSDGRSVTLLANIDLLHEIDGARAAGAEGIGLFRSEFLFLEASPELPGEDEQIRVYEALLQAFPHHPVTVRTFDLGGKKLARELLGSPEANPVLGLRGVRLCLQKPDFFLTQLRALLRAAGAAAGNLRIMVPMVGSVDEIRTVRVLLSRVAAELRARGAAVPDRVALGAMVEVPAAALIVEHLAREVDFFAIGTNDLTQYTLAVDRANEQVADLYRPLHPAVLRLVDRVIAAGRDAGIPVSMCGELAADPLAVPVLLGLGLEEFSMHAQALPSVRNIIRSITFREAKRIAQRALALPSAKAVEEYLLERLAGLLAHLKVRIRL
jgi:phosphotransferase system enzyme I (PtsI)